MRGTDSSLLDEWERLSRPVDDDADDLVGDGPLAGTGEEAPARPVTGNPRAFRRLVRNAMFRRVELAAREDHRGLAALDGAGGWDADAWGDALDPLFEAQGDDAVGIGPGARAAALFQVVEPGGEVPPGHTEPTTDHAPGGVVPAGTWLVRQVLDDPAGDHDWAITASVDLAASDEAGAPVVTVLAVGPL